MLFKMGSAGTVALLAFRAAAAGLFSSGTYAAGRTVGWFGADDALTEGTDPSPTAAMANPNRSLQRT
jgi:hypothetical protein